MLVYLNQKPMAMNNDTDLKVQPSIQTSQINFSLHRYVLWSWPSYRIYRTRARQLSHLNRYLSRTGYYFSTMNWISISSPACRFIQEWANVSSVMKYPHMIFRSMTGFPFLIDHSIDSLSECLWRGLATTIPTGMHTCAREAKTLWIKLPLSYLWITWISQDYRPLGSHKFRLIGPWRWMSVD